jgi:hypothetical protein
MTAPARNSVTGSAIEQPASALAVLSVSGFPHINPVTGLSTDYLNHFTEALMVLEMAGDIPECIYDLRDWRPKTYTEHFAASHFSNRDLVVRAYRGTDPTVRAALDAIADTLNATLVATRDGVLRMTNVDVLRRYSLGVVRPLLARLVTVINGATQAAGRANAQAEIDAMFGR